MATASSASPLALLLLRVLLLRLLEPELALALALELVPLLVQALPLGSLRFECEYVQRCLYPATKNDASFQLVRCLLGYSKLSL
jgi:hypothetical protein